MTEFKIHAFYENPAYTKEFVIDAAAANSADDWVTFKGNSQYIRIPRKQIHEFSNWVQRIAAEAAK